MSKKTSVDATVSTDSLTKRNIKAIAPVLVAQVAVIAASVVAQVIMNKKSSN